MKWYRVLLIACCTITSFCIGLGNTIKQGINSEMSKHSCVEVACLISFIFAFILIGLYNTVGWIFGISRTGEKIPTFKEGLLNTERWKLSAPFIGIISLSLQTYAIYYLGASLMKVLLCSAEVTMSAILDITGGLGAGDGRKPSWITLAAVLCAFAGVGVIMYEDWYGERLNTSIELKVFVVLCPLIAGCLRPTQSRINAALSADLGSKIRGALYYFGAASILFFLTSIVNVAVDTDSLALLWETLQNKNDWWMFCSGVFALCAVLGAIVLPPLMTLGSYYICMTSGQLTMALILDSMGAFSFEYKKVTFPRLFGTILTIIGSMLSQLPVMIEKYKVKKECEGFVQV